MGCNRSKPKSRFQAFCPPGHVSKRSTSAPKQVGIGSRPYLDVSMNCVFPKEEIDILPASWGPLNASTTQFAKFVLYAIKGHH